MRFSSGRFVSALISLLAFGSMADAQTQYRIIDLGTLGGSLSDGLGLNNAGLVVGSARNTSNQSRAFLYDLSRPEGQRMVNLGTLGGASSFATGINASGVIAGRSGTGTGGTQAFVYTNGTMQSIGTLGGPTSVANGINDNGYIVGRAEMADGSRRAYLYDPNKPEGQRMRNLGTLGGVASTANAVNNSGKVVGIASRTDGTDAPFLYDGQNMIDLNPNGVGNGQALGINDAGAVVGYADDRTVGGTPRAFLYQNGSLQFLGALGTDPFLYSEARDINNRGQVVGYSDTAAGGESGFLYDGSTLYDVNGLLENPAGWVVTRATAINDAGWIVGTARTPTSGNSTHAVLLRPVPGPGSLSVFVTALLPATLWLLRRRVPVLNSI